jgi:hypothetical protein
MAEFLGGPKVQYFDANGDLLSGGKLYTYEPGTTTNKATYATTADAIAGTNANANPVILDSRGEADVVLAGTTKLVLTDSSDVTIWTLDNVGSSTDLLDSNGDEILVFSEATSPVNHVQIGNAATGAAPKIAAVGDDTNVGLELESKAAGNIVLDPGTTGDVVIEGGSLFIDSTEGIRDAGGDEYLLFTESSTPVNYFNMTSSNTGIAPSLTTAGSDTNVGMIIDAKGVGTITIGSADVPVILDTDTLTIKTASSTRADFTDSGMQLGGANARVTTVLDEDTMASDSATALATQQSIKAYADSKGASAAESEAASSTSVYLTPGNGHRHPGMGKAWGSVTYSAGTPTLQTSYNMTSITDVAIGIIKFNYDTDFSTANHAVTGSAVDASAVTFLSSDTVPVVGTCEFSTVSWTTGNPIDPDRVYCIAMGDH